MWPLGHAFAKIEANNETESQELNKYDRTFGELAHLKTNPSEPEDRLMK